MTSAPRTPARARITWACAQRLHHTGTVDGAPLPHGVPRFRIEPHHVFPRLLILRDHVTNQRYEADSVADAKRTARQVLDEERRAACA